MAIEKIDKDLDTIDSILTKLGRILRKHWWILLLGLTGWFFYYAFTADFEEDYEEDYQEVLPLENDISDDEEYFEEVPEILNTEEVHFNETPTPYGELNDNNYEEYYQKYIE